MSVLESRKSEPTILDAVHFAVSGGLFTAIGSWIIFYAIAAWPEASRLFATDPVGLAFLHSVIPPVLGILFCLLTFVGIVALRWPGIARYRAGALTLLLLLPGLFLVGDWLAARWSSTQSDAFGFRAIVLFLGASWAWVLNAMLTRRQHT